MGQLNRLLVSALIALMAGVSFGVTILPAAVSRFLPDIGSDFAVLSGLRALPTALFWMPGGAYVGYVGGGRRGALALGLWALLVGTLYGLLVAPADARLALAGLSALTAALYGAGGGLLIGAAFPVDQKDARQGSDITSARTGIRRISKKEGDQ